MIKSERSEKILKILDTDTYVSVGKLSELLYVSLPTVRRDLAELESSGLIVRSHGGAKKLNDGDYVVPLVFRNTYKISEKKELCRRAARLIKDGDTVFIDESTTAGFVGEFIDAKNVTAVTNGITSAEILLKRGIKTYFVGGELFECSHAAFGSMSEKFVSTFNFDYAFFSSYGISNDGMIVDTDLNSTLLRRAVFGNTKEKVFIYDSEKLGKQAPYNIIPLDSVEHKITM